MKEKKKNLLKLYYDIMYLRCAVVLSKMSIWLPILTTVRNRHSIKIRTDHLLFIPAITLCREVDSTCKNMTQNPILCFLVLVFYKGTSKNKLYPSEELCQLVMQNETPFQILFLLI